MKIKLTTTDTGHGGCFGEILDVSEARAERWCQRGLAELVIAAPPEASAPPPAPPVEKKPKK